MTAWVTVLLVTVVYLGRTLAVGLFSGRTM